MPSTLCVNAVVWCLGLKVACRGTDAHLFHCRRPPLAVLAVVIIVVLLAGHAIHDGHKADGNPFVWLFGRLGFSIVLYLHPYYQVIHLRPKVRHRRTGLQTSVHVRTEHLCGGAQCDAKDHRHYRHRPLLFHSATAE